MPAPYHGGCQCGRVRYEIRGEPLAVYACHCRECQRQSASAFGLSMPVHRKDVVMSGAAPKRFIRQAKSGRTVTGAFCETCGTRLFHEPSGEADTVNIKPGTLDDPSWIEPVAHVWLRSRQPWVVVPEGVLRYDEQPPNRDAIYARWRARSTRR
ncbi:MAG: GFA family protein [Alphaproteobacteria bacterium]|nr:GFA family protein [Alphaproteobacteria bacterium]